VPTEKLCGVFTDSRIDGQGKLFVALKGEKHDAHDFVEKITGAGGVMVRKAWQGNAPSVLEVENPNQGLMDLAQGYRKATGAKIVGITGSVGKTTVKEMTAAVVRTLGETTKTLGNFNNEVGLPLSILSMPRTCRYGVFEAGISHPGEMKPLATVMAPDVAVVTSIGPVHLEAFGTVEAIANEKAELLRALKPDGVAVLDMDGEYFEFLKRQAPCRVVTVSANGNTAADVIAYGIDDVDGDFTVRTREGQYEYVNTGFPGHHHVTNALLALAVGRCLGGELEEMADALANVERPPMRWEVSERDGVTFINDAYNANPVSMAKALETFSRLPCNGRRIAILGDMLELGLDEAELHRQVGRVAAACIIDRLILIGERARWIGDGLAGSRPRDANDLPKPYLCPNVATAKMTLADIIRPGDAVLIKASRGMALEKILE